MGELRLAQQIEELSENLRTFAQDTSQNKHEIGALAERLGLLEARLENEIDDIAKNFATHHAVNHAQKETDELEERVTANFNELQAQVERNTKDIAFLDEKRMEADDGEHEITPVDDLLAELESLAVDYNLEGDASAEFGVLHAARIVRKYTKEGRL